MQGTNSFRPDYDPHLECQRPDYCECPLCREEAYESGDLIDEYDEYDEAEDWGDRD